MLGFINRLVGHVEAVEKDGMITISGITGKVFFNDIYTRWGTSKLVEYMITTKGRSVISFYSFYAIDILYIIEELIAQPKRRTPLRLLIKTKEALLKDTWLSNTVEPQGNILDYNQLKEINVDLLSHQKEFLETYDRNVPMYNLKGYILAATPGSGKTLTGLALSLCLKADVVLIVPPKRAVYEVWEANIKKFFKKKQNYQIAADVDKLTKGSKYYIVHYEALPLLLDFVKTHSFKNPVVLLDESHNFNDIDSLRTGLFVDICKYVNAQHVLWASGTPIKAMGAEVVPILRTIDPMFTLKAEVSFRKLYGKAAKRANDVLRNRLGYMTFKVDRGTVIGSQPIVTDVQVKIPNGEDYTLETVREAMRSFIQERLKFYKDHYNEYLDNYNLGLEHFELTLKTGTEKSQFSTYKSYVKQIQRGYDPVLHKEIVVFCNNYELKTIIPRIPANLRGPFKDSRAVVKYVELKVMGEALGRVLSKKRSQCHVDMVRYAGLIDMVDNSIKKTVIFTSYVEVVEEMDRYFRDNGYKPLTVYGKTNKDFDKIVKVFDKDQDANPLIATYASLSTAVPLVMANTAIMFNKPFRSLEYEQATARIDRLDQDEQVYFVNTLLDTDGKDNISTRSDDIMQWSKEQVESLLGTKADGDISLESYVDFIEGVDLPLVSLSW